MRSAVTFAAICTLLAAYQPSARAQEEKDTALPVTRVALYKNGVGFFEHTGHVSGNAAVTIDFTSSQLNDVLQSLTAIDLNGGRISGADYNSTTPLEQQLKTLPISLDANPTAADFYGSIRGARVEVHSGAASLVGRLLSVEMRDSDDPKAEGKRHFLTVVADNGEVRSLELTPTSSVRILDPSLSTDVTRYLKLLDSTRSQGLRHLTLADHGSGSRELRVSYISEVPVWKSTYRILFSESSAKTAKPTATLQGWSVVDNTTGADWINVHLSLIAGAPQSFIQPLSQPIYSRRPEVPIATEAQLTPQTFESGYVANMVKADAAPAPPPPLAAPRSVMMGNGMGAGVGGNVGGGVYHGSVNQSVTVSSDMVESLPLQGRNFANYQSYAAASIAPDTTTAAFDDFFAYNLTEPVTIHKNESALVPILQSKIPADRVTLVHSDGNRIAQPLRALWITNGTGLTLDRGSFSIVEEGNFGGEGLLDPIHPNERRLLSYAADQAVHVSIEDRSGTSHIVKITATKGVLVMHSASVTHLTYSIHNSADETRTVVLEHPKQGGYDLDKSAAPEETTPTLYRFKITTAAGETQKLPLTFRNAGSTTYYLTSTNDDQLNYLIVQANDNDRLKAALQPIFEARRRVADAEARVKETQATLEALHANEERQRNNITALKDADHTVRDRFVNDLNRTEDEVVAAQKELDTRNAALRDAKADLSRKIETFQMDETV